MNDIRNFSNDIMNDKRSQFSVMNDIMNDNKGENIVNDNISQKRDSLGFVYMYRQRHHLLSPLRMDSMQSYGAV